MSRLPVLCFFAFALFFISCKRSIKNRQELILYVNDPANGLEKEQQIGKVNAKMTYKPWQLFKQSGGVMDNQTNKKERYLFDDKLFFVLSLSANNKELLKQLDFNKYSEMVQVLSFRMKDFMGIVSGDAKPVEPLDCIFQQTYGMGRSNDLLIVFNRNALNVNGTLKLYLKEFGLKIGNLEFDFQADDINAIPNDITN